MASYDLSIIIPARNEMFLAKTIENILENLEGNTEIIAVMDGYWSEPPINQHPRVTIVHNQNSIGQRAATNQGVKLSRAKYIMKCDAHCAFDKGFDVKMMNEMHDDWTMVPILKNLHAFDWLCPDGHRRYQGPSGPCEVCGKDTVRDILWQPKPSPNSVSYCFDATPHFQYFGDFAKRPEGQGEITETMSLQGSCWMLTRDKYWELNVCDEAFGSWGSQGIEVAVKTWLSGGRVMVNRKTWYAHMFRTQGKDFGFPYQMSYSDQEKAKSFARELFFNNKWEKQVRPLSWLVEKFWPVKGWTEEDLANLKKNTFKFAEETTGVVKPVESEPASEETQPVMEVQNHTVIVFEASQMPHLKETPKEKEIIEEPSKGPSKEMIYYTDNQLQTKIARMVRRRLTEIAIKKDMAIISASLKPMDFGSNIYLPLTRGYVTMFKQILAALEASTADVVFFCEHDVLYHPSHFDFIPPSKEKFYYNTNVWRLNSETGHAIHFDYCRQQSGICVYRELALAHYRKRLDLIKKVGFTWSLGFEPGLNSRETRVDNVGAETWSSEFPNVDIRHGGNLSPTLWKKEEFRNQRFTKGWMETDDEIPGWGKTKDLIKNLN